METTREKEHILKNELIDKIDARRAKVGIVGLGYVGLPLAVEVANAGFEAIGVDISERTVDTVNAGRSHIKDVPSNILKKLVDEKRITAYREYEVLKGADCISIAVPTPLRKTKDPDISYISACMDALLPRLRKGTLVVLESTTYPGTTEELIASRVETELGLAVGEDIFIAFSPERVDPGNPTWHTKNTPKVVGGVTQSCTEVAKAFYSAVMDSVHAVASSREAEMVKLLENTFRAVNIGLVNEFLLMCNRLEIDVWNVIGAAATKPFGYMPFYPGPGIGGHCIPLDPSYLSWKAKSVDFYNRFIEMATDINGNMPRFVVSKLADVLNDHGKSLKGTRILILGMAYKKNVNDLRESPGLEIYGLLKKKGAVPEYHDPHTTSFVAHDGLVVESIPIDGGVLDKFDLAVLVTDHDAFDYAHIAKTVGLVLDCRNAFFTHGVSGANIVRL